MNTKTHAPTDLKLQAFEEELRQAKNRVNTLTRAKRRAQRQAFLLYPTSGPHETLAYTALLLLSYEGVVERGDFARPRLFDRVMQRLVKARYAVRKAPHLYHASPESAFLS